MTMEIENPLGPAARGLVCIVDDDEAMAKTLAKAMTRRGFTAAWTTSAVEALEMLEQRRFDVVITDAHMPGMSGFSLCEQVGERWPGLPVIVITAFGTVDSESSARAAGAFEFMTKPFELDMLGSALARAVAAGVELKETPHP